MHGPLEVPDPTAGPLDVRVRAVTQLIADQLAKGIAAHPEDWHMLQKMWIGGEPEHAGQAGPVP
jgi:KDO2-lipid IV(A) lauroyltransferase